LIGSIPEAHSGVVCGLSAEWTDEGEITLVSASLDKKCKIWESTSACAEPSATTEVTFKSGILHGLEISSHAGDRRIAVCPTDGGCIAVSSHKTVQVWDRWATLNPKP